MGKPIKFVTPELRLSYCHLFEPRAMDGQPDKPKYSVTVLIPKSDKALVKQIEAAIQKAVDENQDKLKKKKGLKLPLRDGDEKDNNPEYADHYYMSISSKDRPIVLDENKEDMIDKKQCYSGMRGRVSFNFFAFDTAGNKGIACGLNSVMKTNDDEPFGTVYTEDEARDDFSGSTKPKKKASSDEEEDDDDLL